MEEERHGRRRKGYIKWKRKIGKKIMGHWLKEKLNGKGRQGRIMEAELVSRKGKESEWKGRISRRK